MVLGQRQQRHQRQLSEALLLTADNNDDDMHNDDDNENMNMNKNKNKNKNQHHCYGAPRITIIFITAIFVVIVLFCLSLSSKLTLPSSNNNKSSLLHGANHYLDENTSSNKRRSTRSSRRNNNEDQQQQQQQSQSSVSLLYNSPNEIPMNIINKLDVILVLGGGKPKSIHHPPLYVEKRCDDAIEIISRRRKTSGDISSNIRKNISTTSNNELAILCLSAGTAHLSQLLSPDGLPIWESTACASYILSKMKELEEVEEDNSSNLNSNNPDYPPEIYVETTSYDTIGNAFYARTSHTDIMKNWNNLLIITNEFHMERTQKIFSWIFSIDNNDEGSSSSNYELYFLQSPNIGLSSEAITARKQREHQSSIHIDHLVKEKTTLQQVYQFLTNDHSLYTAQYLIDRGSQQEQQQQEQQQQSKNKMDSEEEDVVKDNVKLSYGM